MGSVVKRVSSIVRFRQSLENLRRQGGQNGTEKNWLTIISEQQWCRTEQRKRTGRLYMQSPKWTAWDRKETELVDCITTEQHWNREKNRLTGLRTEQHGTAHILNSKGLLIFWTAWDCTYSEHGTVRAAELNVRWPQAETDNLISLNGKELV